MIIFSHNEGEMRYYLSLVITYYLLPFLCPPSIQNVTKVASRILHATRHEHFSTAPFIYTSSLSPPTLNKSDPQFLSHFSSSHSRAKHQPLTPIYKYRSSTQTLHTNPQHQPSTPFLNTNSKISRFNDYHQHRPSTPCLNTNLVLPTNPSYSLPIPTIPKSIFFVLDRLELSVIWFNRKFVPGAS